MALNNLDRLVGAVSAFPEKHARVVAPHITSQSHSNLSSYYHLVLWHRFSSLSETHFPCSMIAIEDDVLVQRRLGMTGMYTVTPA